MAGNVGEYSWAVTVLNNTGGIKPPRFVWQSAVNGVPNCTLPAIGESITIDLPTVGTKAENCAVEMPKFQLSDRQPGGQGYQFRLFFGADPKKSPPFPAPKKAKKVLKTGFPWGGNTGSGRKKSAGNGKGATAAVFRDAGLKTPDAARAVLRCRDRGRRGRAFR